MCVGYPEYLQSPIANHLELKMTATKRKATDELAEEVAKPAGENVVFVVNYHHHYDDYKRADSSSYVVGAYDSEVYATKKCIVENVVKNEYCEEFTSEILENMLHEAFSNREPDSDTGPNPLSIFSKQEIKQVLSNVPVEKLKLIYSELFNSIAEVYGQYTMRPSMTLYSVQKVKVLSTSDLSDCEEEHEDGKED